LNAKMKIEFLYFENCPGYKPALSLLEQILLEKDIAASIEKIEVTSLELAVQHRFQGSPPFESMESISKVWKRHRTTA